jgi:hypothetical protein
MLERKVIWCLHVRKKSHLVSTCQKENSSSVYQSERKVMGSTRQKENSSIVHLSERKVIWGSTCQKEKSPGVYLRERRIICYPAVFRLPGRKNSQLAPVCQKELSTGIHLSKKKRHTVFTCQ